MHAGARQRGLSLVELLVALALGAFITVGIIQMFTANQETYRVNVGQARLQENARFAMEFVASPIRMAGFTGCFSDNPDVLNVLNDVGGETPFEFDLDDVVEGMNATGVDEWSPDLDDLPVDIPVAGVARVQSGTDVLVVRAVDTMGIRLSGAMASSNATIRASAPPAEDLPNFAAGAVLLISDCEKAAVFQATDLVAGANEIDIEHLPGNVGEVPGNSQEELTDDSSTFGTDASVFPVRTQIFYIAPIEEAAGVLRTNNNGDPVLSLWRKFADTPPQELVEGVEDLQILYGFDTDNDRVPNRYSPTVAGQDTDDIVTIRVTLTVNSVNAVTDQGDGVLDREFSKTVALRNRIGRG